MNSQDLDSQQSGLFSPEASHLGEASRLVEDPKQPSAQEGGFPDARWQGTEQLQEEIELGIQQEALRKAEKLAYNALARREYSAQELEEKLLRKNTPVDVVKMVLRQMRELDLQSDERFTESFVRSRINRGQGPVRIEMELKQRGISAELAEQHLAAEESFWLAQAKTQLARRGVAPSAANSGAEALQDGELSEVLDPVLDPESLTQQQQYEQHQQRQKQRASHARFLASRGFRSNTIANALADTFD